MSDDIFLKGTYKVSFYMHVSEEDALTKEDILQSIAMGFYGQPVLNKLGHFKIENPVSVLPKVGEQVTLRKSIPIQGTYSHLLNDKYVLGIDSNVCGEIDTKVPAQTTAIVNAVTPNGIELTALSFCASDVSPNGEEIKISIPLLVVSQDDIMVKY